MLIAGIALVQLCWRKWVPSDTVNADSSLKVIMYELLLKEKWGMAETIGLFSKELKVNDFGTRLVLNINYCQSLKWQGKTEDLNVELKQYDKSNLSPLYLVALAVLENNNGELYKNLKNAVAIKENRKPK